MSEHIVSKIFWPSHLCRDGLVTGYVVGWNIRGFIFCVTSIVSDIPLADLEESLSKILMDQSDVAVENMNNVCRSKPFVLGVLYTKKQSEVIKNDSVAVSTKKDAASVWLGVEMSSYNVPSIRSIYCNGIRHQNLSSEIILFVPPNPYYLQHLSLDPLDLDTTVAEIVKKSSPEFSAEEQELQDKKKELPETMKRIYQHTFYDPSTRKGRDNELETILHQINCSLDLDSKICAIKASRMALSKKVLKNGIFMLFSYPPLSWILRAVLFCKYVISWPLVLLMLALRLFAEMIIRLLYTKLKPDVIWNGLPLKDFTATGQQIDLRLQQMCFWPYQWMLFREPKWRYSLNNRAQYINFYNTMWLIANDIIFGLAIGSFLIKNNQFVADVLYNDIISYSVQLMREAIVWLMGWPAGLKLNNNLDNFIGEMFLWLIFIWQFFMEALKDFLPAFVTIIGYSGVCGASMTISLISDLLTLLSVHVYVFYSVAARIYNWQLTCLWSLFNLFRGKKYNVLRNRLDSCDYDLDQLLLGTILFTLLFFLFPTVVVYYVLFCFARVTVITTQVFLRTLLSFLNHFPLFGLMIRAKDPRRLPGGIRFDILPADYYTKKGIFERLKRFVFGEPEDESESVTTSRTTSQSNSRRGSTMGQSAVPIAGLRMTAMSEASDKSSNSIRPRTVSSDRLTNIKFYPNLKTSTYMSMQVTTRF